MLVESGAGRLEACLFSFLGEKSLLFVPRWWKCILGGESVTVIPLLKGGGCTAVPKASLKMFEGKRLVCRFLLSVTRLGLGFLGLLNFNQCYFMSYSALPNTHCCHG